MSIVCSYELLLFTLRNPEYFKGGNHSFNDAPCGSKHYGICEKLPADQGGRSFYGFVRIDTGDEKVPFGVTIDDYEGPGSNEDQDESAIAGKSFGGNFTVDDENSSLPHGVTIDDFGIGGMEYPDSDGDGRRLPEEFLSDEESGEDEYEEEPQLPEDLLLTNETMDSDSKAMNNDDRSEKNKRSDGTQTQLINQEPESEAG